jgi:hypothetical protein
MRVRIGIANTDKSAELDVADEEAFVAELERAVSEGGIAWFTDTRGRKVGVPGKNLAFVEMEDDGMAKTVGFTPSG